MAIYHLSAKIISRGTGRSVVAAAAYRAGESLEEESTGLTFDYTRKGGVAFSEIRAPQDAPSWVFDRTQLWNKVEAFEKRKDAQLAREVEVALPIELSADEQRGLLQTFVQREFVDRGMVADFSLHRDDEHNPHAHILLTLRRVGPDGFGPKERSWNERAQLMGWRQSWEELSNAHLAQAGHATRIDHRSLKDQGLDLRPGRKIGVGQERQQGEALPPRIAERVAEQREIARENGERIIADPGLALKALTHMNATFTEHDLAKWLHTRTEGAEQFQSAYLKVTTSADLVLLGRDDRRQARYTSREMLEVERGMLRNGELLAQRTGHGVEGGRAAAARSQQRLSAEQREAFDVLVAPGDLKALVGVAGSGKSRLLAAAKEAWEAQGYTVRGAALSGIAAENLAHASGIESRTLASLEYGWKADRDSLHRKEVLVIDEAGMVGSRQFARVMEAAQKAGTKVVVVGDPEQLQAIEAGAPFRALLAQSGVAELTEVRRQSQTWQRQATALLATGGTTAALKAYEAHGGVVKVDTHEEARAGLVARWDEESHREPGSALMLAYTRDDVAALNTLARQQRQRRGELGKAQMVQTERGEREFAVRDRLYFLRNEKSLGVKNGSLGTIEALRGDMLQVRLDGGERVAVDTRFYRDLDYGYAATVYKAQGSTVDRSYILATSHYDRHSAYVALSRHREAATVFYAAADFPSRYGPAGDSDEAADERFLATLSRVRQKDLAHDYLDPEDGAAGKPRQPSMSMSDIEARQQQAAERWRERELVRGREVRSPDAGQQRAKSHRHSRGGPEGDLGP
ncbi:MAG TPA: Ti-type conjugative transfer relaxase TraA [Steroidobacteraceae bacterium]